MPAKYVTVDGTTLHYLHTGPTTLPGVPPALDRGRRFLLVHGSGGNAGLWRRQLGGLAPTHGAVALDLPAHGRSPGIEGLSSVEEYAVLVARFAAALELGPVVLVGCGMGGAVGLVLAADHPEALAGLALVCTAARFSCPRDRLETLRDVVRGRLPQQFTTEELSPATGEDIAREAWGEQVRTDPRVRYADLLACRAFDGRALLGRVQTPTLVITGADDRLTPAADAEALAGGVGGARLEVIRDAGHQAPLEQSAVVNRLLADFAAGLP